MSAFLPPLQPLHPLRPLLLPLLLLLLLLLSPVTLSQPGYGWDLAASSSTTPTQSNYNCLVTSGFSSAIFRAYHSYGAPDTTAPYALALARAAGATYTDVYMFPCALCSATQSATSQFTATVSNLGSATYGIIWFDIEEDLDGQYWYNYTALGTAAYTKNKAFYTELLTACASAGKKCGVYSNYNNWVMIFGDRTFQAAGGASLPMWFADYDGIPTFYHYKPFGGWWTPVMKQISGTGSACSITEDQSWYFDAATIWGSSGVGAACSVAGVSGSCQTPSACAFAGGASTPGTCTSGTNVQCCTPVACTYSGTTGVCLPALACSNNTGAAHTGICSGSNVCCINPSCTSSTNGAGLCIDSPTCGIFGNTIDLTVTCPGPTDILCCNLQPKFPSSTTAATTTTTTTAVATTTTKITTTTTTAAATTSTTTTTASASTTTPPPTTTTTTSKPTTSTKTTTTALPTTTSTTKATTSALTTSTTKATTTTAPSSTGTTTSSSSATTTASPPPGVPTQQPASSPIPTGVAQNALGTGGIAGIAVGVGLLALAAAVAVVFVVIRRRRSPGMGSPSSNALIDDSAPRVAMPLKPLQAAPLPPKAGSLPPGWSEERDPDTGNTYFYNSQSGATQWEKPGHNVN